jgi:hypothetical protein
MISQASGAAVDEFRTQLNRRFRRAGMMGEDWAADTVARASSTATRRPRSQRLGASQPGNPGSDHYDMGTLVVHRSDKILVDLPGCKESPNFGDKRQQLRCKLGVLLSLRSQRSMKRALPISYDSQLFSRGLHTHYERVPLSSRLLSAELSLRKEHPYE